MAWNIRPTEEEKCLLWEAGHIFRDARLHAEALEVFEGMRVLYPDNDEIEVAVGTVYFQAGEWDRACDHYARALELNGQNARAEAHLGELYLVGLKDDKRAFEHFHRAINLDQEAKNGIFAREFLVMARALELTRMPVNEQVGKSDESQEG